MYRRRAALLCILLAGLQASTAQERVSDRPTSPGTVLITGSNRGLGLEFARQYAARAWRVIATARDPEHATELIALAAENAGVAIERLDVMDGASISALAARHKDTPIDILINNAGVLGETEAQTLDTLDYGEFERVMAVNVYGALAVAAAFREQVAASRQKKIVAITSRSGVISEPGWRGPYFYRASKIALNMVMRMLADDLRPRGVIVALVAPFPTDTEMLRELIGPDAASRQAHPADSVARLIGVIDGLSPANSNQPLLADGSVIPW
jgi:NAD(P)-dependent dehydrogenase (short-subunit alcohol dehydrogenase family)